MSAIKTSHTHVQLITKVPSELSKRFMAAQSLWESELQTLKAVVHRLQTNASKPVSTPPDKGSTIKEAQYCDEEKQNRIMNTLQTDLNDLRAELHLALGKQTNVVSSCEIAWVSTALSLVIC